MNRRRLMMRCLEESPLLVHYSSENGFESDLSGNGVVLNRVGGTINDDGTLHLNANTYNYAYIPLKPLGIVSDGNHTIEFKFSFPAGILSSGNKKWIFTPSASTNIGGGNGWDTSLIVGSEFRPVIKVSGKGFANIEKSEFQKDILYTLRYSYSAGVIRLSINDVVFDFVKSYEPDIALFGKSYHGNAYNYYVAEMNIHSIKIWKEATS